MRIHMDVAIRHTMILSWSCNCLQILDLILELEPVGVPTETDPTSPKRSLVRDDGMVEKRIEANEGVWDPGRFEIECHWYYRMKDHEWLDHKPTFHCWYDTTQVEIPMTFKKVRDVSKASKRNGCSNKLLLSLCRNSWRDVEGNWSWHCTCRYYMYMIYALCRVFSHHLNTQK